MYNRCTKGLSIRKMTKEHSFIHSCFIYKLSIYSIFSIINEEEIKQKLVTCFPFVCGPSVDTIHFVWNSKFKTVRFFYYYYFLL